MTETIYTEEGAHCDLCKTKKCVLLALIKEIKNPLRHVYEFSIRRFHAMFEVGLLLALRVIYVGGDAWSIVIGQVVLGGSSYIFLIATYIMCCYQ